MFEDVDWKPGEAHMREHHSYMTAEIANEALRDPDALMFNPDPRSDSGVSVRVIGYSSTLDDVLAIIVVPNDDGDGWYGATGHRANGREKRLYSEANEGGKDDG